MKLQINQKVFICANPLHMTITENNPIIECEIVKIKKTVLITEDGAAETIEYLAEALCFERWLESKDIFTTYQSALERAQQLIGEIKEKRRQTDIEIDKALNEALMLDKTATCTDGIGGLRMTATANLE